MTTFRNEPMASPRSAAKEDEDSEHDDAPYGVHRVAMADNAT